MLIQNNFSYKNSLLNKTYIAKSFFDMNPKSIDFNQARNHYKLFLEEKAYSPTATKIAENFVLQISPIHNKKNHNMLLVALEKFPEIKILINTIQKIEEKQTKTIKLRNKLIKYNRINLDNVTPKITGLKKLILKLKVMF